MIFQMTVDVVKVLGSEFFQFWLSGDSWLKQGAFGGQFT